MTTNHLPVDSFTYTNGMFYPDPNSTIEESKKKTEASLHP